MIGLVLISHGRLAIEFRAALEHVVGPQKQIEAVTIGPDDDVEQCRKNISAAVTRVDSGDGVAILTDMFGGVPSNLGISLMRGEHIEVMAGLNLPMLIKIAKVRETAKLNDAVEAGQIAGRKYVTIASKVLAGSLIPEQRDKEETESVVVQRPAAFRFGFRNNKIDALPETPEVVDKSVANDLYQQLLAKTRVLRLRLAQTNSDIRVQHSVERLLDALGNQFDDVRPGVLLSRSRSIESDRKAFDNEEARRELFPAAISMLDDVLLSLQDFTAVYPIVRKIEAERLALAIQGDRTLLVAIQAETAEIKVAAASSEAVTNNAVAALQENDAEIEEASALEVRASLIADQLLIVRNFVSEILRAVRDYGTEAVAKMTPSLKQASSDLKEVGTEIWEEVRQNLPRGVGKAARVLPLVILVGLLAKISLPVAGLATLVGGFKPIAKAIKQLKNPVSSKDEENSVPKLKKGAAAKSNKTKSRKS